MTIDGRGAQRELGRVARLKPRDVWPDEARDFTYWLRNNPDILGEALGLDVVITDSEVAVGGFNVDLVGEDVSRDRRLIVENQLERTDHFHLGQILTYAAGLDAATIVWVSPEFRDEHRQAIDWLNAHTDDSVDFFGLQLEVIQIGTSLPAPNLKPVATPNAWHTRGQEAIRQATAPTETALARQRFFEAALVELKRRQPGVTNATRVGTGNWFVIGAGRAGVSFWWWLPKGSGLRVCLVFEDPDPAVNDALFGWFHERRGTYEQRVGEPLEWERLDGKKSSRVGLSREIAGPALEDDPELLDWAVRSMLALNNAFRADIRSLPAPAPLAGPPASPPSD